jgi:protein-disulfide isomerase
MMNEFFKRNSPIFYIGIFIAVVFLFIIFLGQNTPNTSPSLQPANEAELLSDKDLVIGFKDSRVTVVEFLDYNCPYCKQISPNLKNLLDGNKNKVRLVIKHLPLVQLSGHESSYLAAQAVQAANKFDKGEDMHNTLVNADKIDRDLIINTIKNLGINQEEFEKILDSDEIKKEVDQNLETAKKFQLRGTPSIFVNGKQIDLQRQDLNTVVLAEINRVYPQN